MHLEKDLHSNMVRFIIKLLAVGNQSAADLHSNMVRFIIGVLKMEGESKEVFTFQYG